MNLTTSSSKVTVMNSTGIMTQSAETASYRHAAHVIRSVLCVLVVSLNTLVIVMTLRMKKLGSRMLFFVLHLSIADLSVGLLYVLPDALEDEVTNWTFGPVWCKLKWFLSNTVMFSSTYLLVAMALDRLYVVVWPMHCSIRGLKSAKIMVIVVWVLSILMSLPMLKIANVIMLQNNKYVCTFQLLHESHLPIYVTSYFLLIFLIPVVIVAACYFTIVWVIWRKSSSRRVLKKKACGISRTVDPGSLRKNNSNLPAAKARSLVMTVIIVITFILCWGPFFTYFLLSIYDVIERKMEQYLIQALAPLNSAANPFICICFNYRIFFQNCFTKT